MEVGRLVVQVLVVLRKEEPSMLEDPLELEYQLVEVPLPEVQHKDYHPGL